VGPGRPPPRHPRTLRPTPRTKRTGRTRPCARERSRQRAPAPPGPHQRQSTRLTADGAPSAASLGRHSLVVRNAANGPKRRTLKPPPEWLSPVSHGFGLGPSPVPAAEEALGMARRPTQVRDGEHAIVDLLAAAQAELRVKEIRPGVEARLGGRVSRLSCRTTSSRDRKDRSDCSSAPGTGTTVLCDLLPCLATGGLLRLRPYVP